jgi:hypothetical protein
MALTVDITSTTVTMKISGTALNTSSSIDGDSSISNYSVTMTDTSTNTSIDIAIMVENSEVNNGTSGNIYVYTPTPLSDDNSCGNFNSGSMRINGSDGSYLLLTANHDCTVTVTGVSDTGAAIGPTNYLWTDL